MQRRVYFDYLDSLRFFAFFVVFIAHAAILFPVSSDWFYSLYRSILSNGSYGVNFFFILSGFLITYLLLAEKKNTGDVSIKVFYLKRVLRIWPLYYLVFILSLYVIPFFVNFLGANYMAGNINTFPNLHTTISDGGSWWYLLFVGNFYRAYDLGITPFALGVLWSVCVEEQFYLFWPWVVKKFSATNMMYFAWIIFALSLIYKAIHINDANMAYYGTLSVSMDLALGCILGVLYFNNEKGIRLAWQNTQNFLNKLFSNYKEGTKIAIIFFKDFARGLKKMILMNDIKKKKSSAQIFWEILLFVILIASMGTYISMQFSEGGYGLFYDFLRLMKRPVLNIFFLLFLLAFLLRKPRNIIEQPNSDISTSASAFKSSKSIWYNRFTYLGRISYGLYAYHAIFLIIVLAIFNHFGMGPNDVTLFHFLSIFSISLALTIVTSHYSYKYMEGPFISLRNRKGALYK